MRIGLFTSCIIFILFPSICTATHLRAGEIQVRRIDCNALTFEITVVIYVNTNSPVAVGGDDDFLSFGDGTRIPVSETPVTELIDAGAGIGKTIFRTLYTYKNTGRFIISYNEPNRNEGVANMEGSAFNRFQVEAMILIEEGKCNSFPVLLNPPIDRACNKFAFYHNPAAFDAENDSLSFELAVPKRDDTNPVANYRLPNHPSFYVQSQFAFANEAGTSTPTFQINATTGLLTWDAPGLTGPFSAAIKIREWKKNATGNWYESSYFIRDMEIAVTECNNQRPSLSIPENICVVAGNPVELLFHATDADGDSVRIDLFSELFENANYKPTISPATNVGTFRRSPLDLKFRLETSCTRVRTEPYVLTVKLSDNGKNGPSLSRYFTVNISVIPPPPHLDIVNVNPVSRQVSLEWSMPGCDNIQSYQVWRRTSSVEYNETECSKGMPAFLRYDLIASIPAPSHSFVDTDLQIGAQYCYRIVAIVNGIAGKLSVDTCIIPKPAEAPVITNVSVEDTDQSFGKIAVRWTHPYEIDQSQYPPPYKYQVLRRNETLNTPFERIGEIQTDTVFIDHSLNTSENSFRYFVELYVSTLTDLPLDSSSQASSVVATSQSKVGQIDLAWSAKTPWSNSSARNPNHLIFRSTKKDGPFELIDSVNVFTNGFAYIDRGRFKNLGLSRDAYYYKIKTRGTYGNPDIDDPLENFSPAFFGQVLDTIPPCAPLVSIESIECNRFACDGLNYYTVLQWQSTDEKCDEDVVAYEVLVKSDTARHFVSLGKVTVPSFRHDFLNNLDYCYRVVSIDHIGNRSDSSVVVCNTSCLTFKLPNVITPGRIDEKNDFLASYDGDNSSDIDCARSVKKVELLVYNRWGDEIFVKEIANQESKILWPGTNTFGAEVEAGIYYFNAKVSFQTNDPSKRLQEIKGWVQVLR